MRTKEAGNLRTGRAPKAWIVSILLLLLFPSSGLHARQLLLNDVKITQEGECVVVRVEFSFPLRYVNHFPFDSGDDLRIKFEPIAINPVERNELFLRETILPPPNNSASLSQVIYEGNIPGGPFLTLLFQHRVGFEVKQGADFRSLVIGVHGLGKPDVRCEARADSSTAPAASKKSVQGQLPTSSPQDIEQGAGTPLLTALPLRAGQSDTTIIGGGAEVKVDLSNRYAVNLLSTLKPIDPVSLPMLAIFARYRLYITRFRKDGKVWDRLRLGFFPTRKAAEEVAESLQGTFKRAWVTVVSRQERERSAQSAIVFVTPPDLKQRFRSEGLASVQKTGERDNAPSPQSSEERVAAAGLNAPPPAVPSQPVVAEQQSVDGERANAPRISEARLEGLMQEAERAMTSRDYQKAIQFYTKILQYPDHKFRQSAQEFLGLARARNGQLAQARAEYEQYLRLYSEGEAADRVRQRLAGIVTARAKPKVKLSKAKESKARTDIYGTFSQFYNRVESFTDLGGNVVSQNAMTTDLNLIINRKTSKYRVSYVLNTGYAYDSLDRGDSVTSMSQNYVDLLDRRRGISSRLGRQSRSTDGVLGRFDGGVLSYQFSQWGKVNGLAGILLDSTKFRDYDTDRYFFGASIDLGTFAKHWNFNLFTNRQQNNGIIDRHSVGGEVRYFHPKGNFFGFMDYDFPYNELNTALLVGNWTFPDKTTINAVADYRKSPILTTNNALIGQGVESLSDLLATLSENQVRDLARDRTAVSKTFTLGATRPLNPKLQLNANFTTSELTGTEASGGVEAAPGTGWEFFYSTQVIGSSLIKQGDIAILGLRYANTNNFNTFLMDLNTRYPLLRELRFNPRMVISYSAGKASTADRLNFRPSLTMDYYWKRHIRFELNGGMEFRPDWVSGQTDSSFDYFLRLGYHANF